MKRYFDKDENELTHEEYLYGKDVDVPNIPADVIMRRIELLDDHILELFKAPIIDRDGARLNAVIKAKNFWLKINEVEF